MDHQAVNGSDGERIFPNQRTLYAFFIEATPWLESNRVLGIERVPYWFRVTQAEVAPKGVSETPSEGIEGCLTVSLEVGPISVFVNGIVCVCPV
jgi:hypothetical protein